MVKINGIRFVVFSIVLFLIGIVGAADGEIPQNLSPKLAMQGHLTQAY